MFPFRSREPQTEELTELELTKFLSGLPKELIRGPQIEVDDDRRSLHPNRAVSELMGKLSQLHNQYRYQLTTLTTHETQLGPRDDIHSLDILLYDHMGQLGKTLILGDCLHTVRFSYYVTRARQKKFLKESRSN